MRIHTEYMSFKNRWMISSSYDFQAHQQHSQRRCHFPTLLYSDSRCSQVLPVLLSALPDLLSALPDLLSALPGLLPALPGAPRCTQSSLRRSEMFSNLSQSLPWNSCTGHRRSQLLRRPAGMPSHCLILSWNWRIYVYTPHTLRHSWRLPVTKIHFADVCFHTEILTNLDILYDFITYGSII